MHELPRRADPGARRGLGQPLPDREGRGRRVHRGRRGGGRRARRLGGDRDRQRPAATATPRERRDELERTVRALEATTEIARAIGGETDLDRVLELIVKRGRALVEARALLIALRATATSSWSRPSPGEVAAGRGRHRAADRGLGRPATALRTRRAAASRPGSPGCGRACAGARRARGELVVPLLFRGRALGRPRRVRPRSTTARRSPTRTSGCCWPSRRARRPRSRRRSTGRRGAPRRASRPPRRERDRWARELHDETLQELGALQLLLSAARRCRATPSAGAARSSRRVDQLSDGDRQAARADHRPAPGGARRARRRAGDRGAGRARRRAIRPRDRARDRPRLRGGAGADAARAGGRDDDLPDRPGGADQRGQARRRDARRGAGARGPTTASTRGRATTAAGFDPDDDGAPTGSGCSGCASGSRSSAARSRSSAHPARARRSTPTSRPGAGGRRRTSRRLRRER